MNHSCLSFSFNFIPQLFSFRIILSNLHVITCLTTTSLNSLILYSIWKNPTLHKPSYLLLANLALSDLLFGAFADTLKVLAFYAYMKKWTAKSFCYISAITYAISYWLGSISLYCLTIISVDRLLAIRLKNRYRSFVTSRRIWMVTIPYWVGMFLLLLTLLLSNVLQSSIYFLTLSFLLVFLTTIIACYSMSLYLLKKLTSSVSFSSCQQPDNGSSNFDVSQYRRSTFTMLIVMFTSLLLYLPHLCSVVAHSIVDKQGFFSATVYKILRSSELIVSLNPTVNPLVYLWRMQDIREAVKTTLKCGLRRGDNSVEGEQR